MPPKPKPSTGPKKTARKTEFVVTEVPNQKIREPKTPEQLEIEATLMKAARFRDTPAGNDTKKHTAKLEEYAEEDLAEHLASEPSSDESSSWEPSEWQPQFTRGTHISSIMLASRNSGKSYLAKYLIESRMVNKFDVAFVVCGSPKERDNYVDILSRIHVFTQAFPDLPDDLWSRIKETQAKRDAEGKKMLDILLLFDDSVGNKYSEDVKEIYCCGRHHGTTCFYLVQAVTILQPTVRQNTDILILLKAKSAKLRETIIEQMLRGTVELGDVKGVDEKKFYQRLLSTYAKKQGDALVLDCRDPSQRANQEEEELFRFRAPPLEGPPEEDDTSE